MGKSTIEWTHYTFNPWIGCAKVSPGCKNCYAEKDMDQRRGRACWGVNGTRSVTSYSYWREPYKWNEEAKKSGVRKRVFCASLADVFEDFTGAVVNNKGQKLFWPYFGSYDVDNKPNFNSEICLTPESGIADFSLTLDTIRLELFSLIARTPHLDWLLLTKRPENIKKMVFLDWAEEVFPDNVWVGTSVENKKEATNRIPHLMQVPAKVRFLSCEPLLEKVFIDDFTYGATGINAFNGRDEYLGFPTDFDYPVNWVIVGGESGHNARPMDIEWAREIMFECKRANVPFFFKQDSQATNKTYKDDSTFPVDLQVREFPIIK